MGTGRARVVELLKFLNRRTIPFRIWLPFLAGMMLSLVRRIYWALSRGPGPKPHQALYVVKNSLGIFYALENARLLSRHTHLECVITGGRALESEIEERARVEGIAITFQPLRLALFRSYAIILFPHHYLAALFDASTPKVYISHGIETGKLMNRYGTLYTYGFKGMLTRGRPRYQRMLATSVGERRTATREYSAYAPVIRISTEAVLERLLQRAEQRDLLRRRSGLDANKPAILFMSTWGSPSLLADWGTELLARIDSLQREFHIALAVHPRCYESRRVTATVNSLQATGVRVLSHRSSWIDDLVVADAAVADITSLCLYASLLLRTTVFLRPPMERVSEDLMGDLVRHSPRLDSLEGLAETLHRAATTPNRSYLRQLRSQFRHLGNSTHLVASLISVLEPEARQRYVGSEPDTERDVRQMLP